MREILLVGGGSFIGGIGRYGLAQLMFRFIPDARFPIATFLANFLGCFAIGLLMGSDESRNLVTPNLRLFLVVGILGGFTTFSTFGYDTVALLRSGRGDLALMNVLLSVIICLSAVWIGLRIPRFF